MPNYAANAATARVKIAEYGKTVTLQAPASGGNSWDGGGTLPDPVSAKFLETGYSITHRNESAVQAGDLVGFLDDSAEVRAGWKMTLDAVEYEIIDAKRVAPGPVLIMTEIVARR